MNPERRALAELVSYVFQTLGRRRIGEDDWVRVLSLERKWLPPSKARLVAGRARALGLLRNAGERDFDVGLEADGLELPVDYRPDLAVLESATAPTPEPAAPPLFIRVARAVAQRLNLSEAETIGRINATQAATGGLLTAEVAAIYFGALQGVDMGPFLGEAEATLRPPQRAVTLTT